MLTTLKRIFRYGFINFWRNAFVSLSTILVMFITLFVISLLIFAGSISTVVVNTLKEKVDINVYLALDAYEEDILDLKKTLEEMPEVSYVEYVTAQQALVDFQERYKNDQKTLEALDVLEGENPLGGVLNIKAAETSQYENVANFLDQNYGENSGSAVIADINYFKNKTVIDKLTQIIETGSNLGTIIAIILVVLSVMITLNTIRLAIYASREEINVMKLVGAGKTFISGPFIITGALYGLVAGIATLVVLYPFTYWIGPKVATLLDDLNLFTYYTDSFAEMFIIILGTGIIIGAISSMFAIYRYLVRK